MPKKRVQNKILLLHTGGTIGMGILPSAPSLMPSHDFVRTLRKTVPELWRLADVEIRTLSNKDSSQIVPRDWHRLASTIAAHSEEYDGFVVSHGTDTMTYTGTALSYLLPFPCKPVILTGSQRPLQEIRSDARRNLINSVAMAATAGAAQRIYEVLIFFDTLLLRANRSKKVHIEEYHTFDSPNFRPLAEERLKTRFREVQREQIRRPSLLPRFDSRIQVVKVFPGAAPELMPRARAVVIEAFGCGNLPMVESSVLAFLKKCVRKKVPVVLTSQVQSGALSPEIYGMGRRALDLGAINSQDMTFEATMVKCMMLAGNNVRYDQWPEAIASNWAGEISTRPAIS